MEKLLIDFKPLRGAAHLNEPVKRFLLKNRGFHKIYMNHHTQSVVRQQ